MTRILTCIKGAAAVVAIGASSFAADAETVDLGVMVPGETYSYPVYTTVTGEYTPSQTGVVKFTYTTNPLAIYTSSDHDESTKVTGSHSYVSGGQMITYSELEAGKTYYLYSAMTLMAGEVTITEGNTELKLLGTSPEIKEDEYFSVSSNYSIDFSFNCPVTLTNALLLFGSERQKISASPNNSYISCDVADAIMKFYRDGVIKKDDVLTLRLVGVADATDSENKFEGKGKIEVNLKMPEKPAELVEVINASIASVDNPFSSYYAENDETGVVSFVFDRDDLSTEIEPSAQITYGNPDNLDVGIYTETVAGVNDGNSASFDFRGKLRRPIDMLPNSDSSTQPTHLGMIFKNIFTSDGQRIFTGRVANPTGFSMSFKMNVIQYSIAADFTPRKGTELTAGKNMEIWVMNGSFINFSGIRFDYTSNGEAAFTVVPFEDLTVEQDPVSESDMIYTFKVPDMAVDNDSDVILSFADLECGDGLDHSNELTAKYSYAMSGVETVGDDVSETVTVFNVAGVCVLKGAARSELSTLPAGLYIVNGEKVVIK